VCFGRPTMWLAVGILLLNDHVLKIACPSWWTGKLSDFAGLLFFPFLVAAVLALVLDRVGLPSRWTGRCAFFLAACWFSLAKTHPVVAAFSEEAWGGLVGGSVSFARDPTDLIALAALWPAWRCWSSTRSCRLESTSVALRRRACVALGVATIASLASVPVEPYLIQRVVTYEGEVYAGSPAADDFERYDPESNKWVDVEEIPDPLHDLLSRAPPLPVVSCVPGDPSTCYRAAGTEVVEISRDGGRTWQVTWRMPAGRREFVSRFSQFKGERLDMGPYDITVGNTGDGHRVVVAMGTEGVLMGSGDGRWERQRVSRAVPTPYASPYLYVIVGTLEVETFVVLAGTLLTPTGLFAVAWRDRTVLRLWILIAALLLIWVGFCSVYRLPVMGVGLFWGGCLIGMAMALGLLGVWLDRSQFRPQPRKARLAALWWSLVSTAFLLGGVPLGCWAAGVIATYEIALLTAIVVTGLVLCLGSRRAVQLLRSAG
jgi:hypothetical protein